MEHHQPTISSSLRFFLLENKLNILLIFFPLGIISHSLHWSDSATFFLNFLAIVPLAKLLGTATEEIAMRTGAVIGGLLNASFGNAVELIVSIVALKDGLIRVVQASLVGSILSNLLLVLGMCFFFGGLRHKEQFFSVTSAQTAGSLLTVSVFCLFIPATFDASLKDKGDSTQKDKIVSQSLPLSRGTSVIMIVVYFLYLYFQLKTHAYLHESTADLPVNNLQVVGTKKGTQNNKFGEDIPMNMIDIKKVEDEAPGPSRSSTSPIRIHDAELGKINSEPDLPEVNSLAITEEDEEVPQMTLHASILALFIVTVLVSISADNMVGSIEGLKHTANLTDSFIGLILVPIVGNAAEHLTAVTVAMKNNMDLALGVAIGSSTQIALLVVPLITIVAWGMDKPMVKYFK